MNPHPRLTLPVKSDNAKTDAKPATQPDIADAKPVARPRKPPFDHASLIREFAFPDGRKISVHRHSVYWAAPLKDDPEHATLVGVKGGEKPVPLMVTYDDFVAWWKA